MKFLLHTLLLITLSSCIKCAKENSLTYTVKGGHKRTIVQEKIKKLLTEGFINLDINKVEEAVKLGATLNEKIIINSIESTFIYILFNNVAKTFYAESIVSPKMKSKILTFFEKSINLGCEISDYDVELPFFAWLCIKNQISDPDKLRILAATSRKFDTNKIQKLKDSELTFSPMQLAIHLNSFPLFMFLFENGARIDFSSKHFGNYLYLATVCQNIKIVNYLIEKNQKIIIPSSLFDDIQQEIQQYGLYIQDQLISSLLEEAFYEHFTLGLAKKEIKLLLGFLNRKSNFEKFAIKFLKLKDKEGHDLIAEVDAKIVDHFISKAPISLLDYENFVFSARLASSEEKVFQFLLIDLVRQRHPEIFSSSNILSLSKVQSSIMIEDADGNTPFSIALDSNNLTFFYSFVNSENVNIKSKSGYTALHLAVKKSDTKAVLGLLAIDGIDVNTFDMFGNTALHYAIGIKDANERIAIVKFLLSKNAKILQNKENKTALDLTKELELSEATCLQSLFETAHV